MSHDHNRREFYNLLQRRGISHGTHKYRQLIAFLNDPVNAPYLQLYYLLCTGYLNIRDIEERTEDLLSELEFVTGHNYTYRALFRLDPEWYAFFKENAYPTGQRRCKSDSRRGVDKIRVDSIMTLKEGPPVVTLETAIVKECQNKCK